MGAVTESDVLLASASEAIIIGFNVRPTANARRLSEQEQIEIRTYSIIYDAINEVKDAMEGMLAPEYKEEIVANLEVRQVYHISKVGTIAGCMVLDGKLTRNTKVRVVRDGVVVFTGEIESLKRFKDDVKEVSKGFECGLSIAKFNEYSRGRTRSKAISGRGQAQVCDPVFSASGALGKRAFRTKNGPEKKRKKLCFKKTPQSICGVFFRGGRSEEGFVSSLGSFQCFFHIGQQFTDRVLVPCGK